MKQQTRKIILASVFGQIEGRQVNIKKAWEEKEGTAVKAGDNKSLEWWSTIMTEKEDHILDKL